MFENAQSQNHNVSDDATAGALLSLRLDQLSEYKMGDWSASILPMMAGDTESEAFQEAEVGFKSLTLIESHSARYLIENLSKQALVLPLCRIQTEVLQEVVAQSVSPKDDAKSLSDVDLDTGLLDAFVTYLDEYAASLEKGEIVEELPDAEELAEEEELVFRQEGRDLTVLGQMRVVRGLKGLIRANTLEEEWVLVEEMGNIDRAFRVEPENHTAPVKVDLMVVLDIATRLNRYDVSEEALSMPEIP